MADRVPGGEGSRSCDSPESTPRSLVAALARDDNQLHSSGTEGVIPRSVPWPRDIGGTPESKSRSFALLRCSGRQKNKSSGGQRVVILRPVFGPKDLGLEVLRSQNRGPSPCSGRQTKATQRSFPFGSAPQSLRSLGTTAKGTRSGWKGVVCHPEAGGMAEGSRP